MSIHIDWTVTSTDLTTSTTRACKYRGVQQRTMRALVYARRKWQVVKAA